MPSGMRVRYEQATKDDRGISYAIYVYGDIFYQPAQLVAGAEMELDRVLPLV